MGNKQVADTFSLFIADSWGNKKDGFEVNDWFAKRHVELKGRTSAAIFRAVNKELGWHLNSKRAVVEHCGDDMYYSYYIVSRHGEVLCRLDSPAHEKEYTRAA